MTPIRVARNAGTKNHDDPQGARRIAQFTPRLIDGPTQSAIPDLLLQGIGMTELERRVTSRGNRILTLRDTSRGLVFAVLAHLSGHLLIERARVERATEADPESSELVRGAIRFNGR